jgi:hypothetical protein
LIQYFENIFTSTHLKERVAITHLAQSGDLNIWPFTQPGLLVAGWIIQNPDRAAPPRQRNQPEQRRLNAFQVG